MKARDVDLYSKLSYIGIRVISQSISKKNTEQPDIEETLIESLYSIDLDSRILSLILSWAKVHHKRILADKFFRTYEGYAKIKGKTPWFEAFCAFVFHLKDHRFKKGVNKVNPKKYLGNRNQDLNIKRKGAIEYLSSINVLIPNGSIRIRPSDILTPLELSKKNSQYRNRLVFGSNWRAEVFGLMKAGAVNPNQVAVKLGLNRSRVSEIFKDIKIVESFLSFP